MSRMLRMWRLWNDKSLALTLGLVAMSACSLPPPNSRTGGGGATGMTEACQDEVAGAGGSGGVTGGGGAGGDGGMSGGAGGTGGMSGGGMSGGLLMSPGGAGGMSGGGGSMSGGAGTGAGGTNVSDDINRVIVPVACANSAPNANAIDKYSQGYTPDPAVLNRVQTVLSTMTLEDEVLQMFGLKITPFYAPFNNIQRSEDTKTIRGFRYRDASRGMNLGEDFSGTYASAGKEPGGSSVGYSTAFPVSMARGAAFDLDLEYEIGEAIADEMQAAKETLLLAPCMNLLRHPLWGRAQETYGEDPYHLGRLASAMTVGIQQHVAANAKHYMANNIENGRAKNNSMMEDEQTLREIYGRHFRMVVQDGGVSSVMAAYNLVNRQKSTENTHLLTEVLRDDFGFKGFVLSDWWAMPNTDPKNADATTLKMTAVKSVKAGLDVELPWGLNYGQLINIINANGGLTKMDIDRSVARILEQKFRFNADPLMGNVGLGTPKTRYRNFRIVCDTAHQALAEKAALKSMVLLKNDNNTLPIKNATKVAVLGARVPYRVTDGATQEGVRYVNFATDVTTGDLGSSRVFHDPEKGVGPFQGIKAAAPSGVEVVNPATVAEAADADFIVVMAGLTAQDEGEEYTKAGDRVDGFALDAKQRDPMYAGLQNKLIADAAMLKKPMVVVLEGGSVISLPWLADVPAVVMAWYPGQRGGAALGKLLWGEVGGTQYNFGGKLPITWGSSVEQYPLFDGKGDTLHTYYVGYRYFDKNNMTPQFHFGHGLSYTTFAYKKLQLGCSEMSKGAVLPVVVNVANTGSVAGDEIVMVFVSFPGTQARRPVKELKGFARVHLAAGEEKQVTVPVRLSDLDYFRMDSATGNTGKWVVESGDIKIAVGGSSTNLPLTAMVKVNGFEKP
jgi:beta-glucosidase